MKRRSRIEITIETRLMVIRRGTEPGPGLVQWVFVAGSMDYAGRSRRAGRRQHAHHLQLGGSRSAPCH